MTKMTSLGQKYSDMDKPVGAKNDEYFPTVYLNEKQMKEMGLGEARVGKETVLCAKVRVASLSETHAGAASMSLELLEAAIEEDAKPDAASVLYGKE